ncbi:MAG: hypothetical protein V4726_13585 [Verrucomicrobiota bacterium]
MEPYSIIPRPVSQSPLSFRPSVQGNRKPSPVSSPPAKPAWNSDALLAGAGLVLLLAGFALKNADPWMLWLGIPTAAGLVLYLCIPALKNHRQGGGWRAQREALMEQWAEVTDQLTPQADQRYTALQQRVSRLGDLFPGQEQGSLLRPGEYMLWLYLKLLLARDHLEESVRSSTEEEVIAHRKQLLDELDSDHLTPSARQSTHETVLILDQRVLTLRSRAGRIREIESDLTRVEQWVALMHDQAAQHNTMGDAGRRLRFGPESLTLPSLGSLPGSNLQQLDALVNSQACS